MVVGNQLIGLVILSGWVLVAVGCAPTLTPEQQRQKEFDRKYPGINYGPVVGGPGYVPKTKPHPKKISQEPDRPLCGIPPEPALRTSNISQEGKI